ncbi:hypothetical protein A2872_04700 [Candidatus Gottesmanbacteria bacterium RIFCSPHIGHO2_01_FULL_42_12]|uniref:Gcp-like domain-containing protein n=1 Tax=Candidatus Gottesmanbacteria bacterium RIFCSPHIGHO2_01_FULL_42_12 TaxID=1798377 RepID=A0A1F5Z0R2_9BACT|nr:MAG: hypothetical protein A2872_04700 [Candidatus Gottesmanbacteria bacterium RIFCSPHIGHO2_01_FULL_42_12]
MKKQDKLKLYIDSSSNKKTTVMLGEKVLEEDSSVWHSQVILPMIKKIIGKRKLDEINGFEIKKTGDSFTGLRVGAAIANALNFALNRKSKIIIPHYE